MDQLSYPCLTTAKTIALSIGTFTGKVMPFLLNTLWFYHNFPCKEQACFNILAVVSFRGDYSKEVFRAAPPRPAPPLHCLRRPGPARLEAPPHTPAVPTRVRLRSTPRPRDDQAPLSPRPQAAAPFHCACAQRPASTEAERGE